MVTDYNIDPENLFLDHKLALANLSRKLKEVLNPFVNEGSSLYGIKIVTDIELPATEIVSFHVNCFSSIERLDSKTIQATGYIDFGNINQEPLILSNTGQERIAQVGVSSLDNKLIIVLSHEGKGSSEILKSEVEVFVSSNNRNHTISIEYLTEDDYNSYASILTTVEEPGTSGFSFSVNTGDESYSISNGSFGQEINKIAVAKEAETLHQDIPITVNQGIQDPDITGSGTIDGTTLEGSLSLEVNTDPIVQKVLEDFELPVATDSVLGGVNIANGYLFPSNQYPVQLKSVNLANYAYVDLNDFKDTLTADKHRYEDMTDATTEHPNLGEVVLYIGPTTVNYTHGYFYMRVRELIQGTLEGNTNWRFTNPATSQSTLNNSITVYNLISDHLLNIDYTLTLTPEVSTITTNTIDDSTVFNVVNDNFSDLLTYGEIKDWGIELYTLTYDDQHPESFIATISLSYVNESNPPIWVLKNVQPAVHMSSALVYKGTCAWAELEGKIPISEPGYFYTVTDKSNQEYFFNGTITSNWEDSWEFMGDVFTLNGKYLVKTKVGSADPVIVSEFEANQSDTTGITLVQGNKVILTSDATNHTVKIAAIDTTYSFAQSGNILTVTLSDGTSGQVYIYKPTFTDKDRYVNQAAFADDSANDSSNPVKMTLTRAGSDSATVTANLPKVSSTSAGVAPKGAVVNTQSQTTKFLREDGTWAAPSYTTNTDTLANWNETDTNSAAYINNKPTIPTVNDATYSVKTDVSGTETVVSDFTANQSTADKLIFVQGNNITLTPDATNNKITIEATDTTYSDFNGSVHGLVPAPGSGDSTKFLQGDGTWATPAGTGDANVIEIVKVNGTALTPDSNKAVDITVFSGSGNSHTSGLVPDPGATAGTSKYLCEDGTWSTPADSDTTYTFAERSTDGAFSVTPSGGSASSVAVHNVLKTTGGTMTGQVYHTINNPTISNNTVEITCDKKYNWVALQGGTLTLNISMPLNSLDGPCEVIYAIKNTHSTNSMTLTLPSTGHNMVGVGSFSIAAGKLAEIVFTFWSTSEVSFNGGVESPV